VDAGPCGVGYTVRLPNSSMTTGNPVTASQILLANGNVTGLVRSTFTVEFWFKTGAGDYIILSRRGSNDMGWTAAVRTIATGTVGVDALIHGTLFHRAQVSATLTGWHHYAWTFNDGSSAVWLDGVKRAATMCTKGVRLATDPTIVNGNCVAAAGTRPEAETTSDGAGIGVFNNADGTKNAAYTGSYDELRLSSSVRYTVSFTPARRHALDAQTLALWHFDEGTGTQADNAAVPGYYATLFGGVQWVADNGYDGRFCP